METTQHLNRSVEETFNLKRFSLSSEPWKKLGNVLKLPVESLAILHPLQRLLQPIFAEQMHGLDKARARQEAVQFMRGIMDEFTHISNYSHPGTKQSSYRLAR